MALIILYDRSHRRHLSYRWTDAGEMLLSVFFSAPIAIGCFWILSVFNADRLRYGDYIIIIEVCRSRLNHDAYV